MIREDHRSPHVRRRAAVEAEAFLRLLEVATDDVNERIERDLHVLGSADLVGLYQKQPK